MHYDKASTRVDKSVDPNYANAYYSKTCAVCGDNFKSQRPHGKYCSHRCSNDAGIARKRKKMNAKRANASVCAICGVPLMQDSGKIKAYCGTACKQKAYRMRKLSAF